MLKTWGFSLISLDTFYISFLNFLPDPPVINISMDKVAIDINQTAILNCQAHSVPPSNFTWYRGSQVLAPGGRMSIMEAMVPSAYPYRTTLSIQDVVMSDLASYRCEAVNSIGKNSFSVQLVVRSKC